MKQEEAESYLGKTVYTVDYGEMEINSHVVHKVVGSTYQSGDTYTLLSEEGTVLYNMKLTWQEAHSKLISYYETRVQVAMDELNLTQRIGNF